MKFKYTIIPFSLYGQDSWELERIKVWKQTLDQTYYVQGIYQNIYQTKVRNIQNLIN